MTARTIPPQDLKPRLTAGGEIALIDTREHGQYGEGHPFFAVNIPYSRLELKAPALLPRKSAPVVLFDDGDGVAERAALRLAAMAYGDIAVMAGGAPGWAAAGFTLFKGVNLPSKAFGELVEHTCHTPSLSAAELKGRVDKGDNLIILDGRSPAEHASFTIPGAVSCPNAELGHRLADMVPNEDTVIVVNCAGRTRSLIGAQSLINLGVANKVLALENGTQGWRIAGFELEHGAERGFPARLSDESLAKSRNHAAALQKEYAIPTIDATTLETWQGDGGRTLYILDVRTAEEFAAGHLAGARHAPGGQLVQGTDQWVAVRGARIVLADDTGLRAAVTAMWLRAMGHDAHVLDADVLDADVTATGDLETGATLPVTLAETLTRRDAAHVAGALEAGAQLVDLNPGMAFRAGHIRGARWGTRPRLGDLGRDPAWEIILAATDPMIAELAAIDLRELGCTALSWLPGAAQDWADAGLDMEETPGEPAEAECIDYLFFVHDRHAGNLDAARRYLAWETGLLDQMDEQEKSVYRLEG